MLKDTKELIFMELDAELALTPVLNDMASLRGLPQPSTVGEFIFLMNEEAEFSVEASPIGTELSEAKQYAKRIQFYMARLMAL